MRDYINQLAKKMAKGGAGIIHHSNFGAYIDPSTGEANLPNTHWRGVTMTAERFRQDCVASGLHCTGQELVPWGYPHLTDCFSVFRRPHKPGEPVQTTVVENPEFWDFIRNQAKVIPVYRPAGVDGYPKHESSRWIDMLRGALRRAWT